MSAPNDTLSVTEAARLLKSENSYVFALVYRGELKPVAIPGQTWRVSRKDLEAYMARHPEDKPGRKRDERDSVVYQ